MTGYVSYILVLIALYSVVALSLDILVGHLGIVSLAQAAFFGIGAYTAAIAVNFLGANLFEAFGLALAVGGASSLAVAIPSLRLHGDYFVIAAFAFQMLAFSLFNNLVELTGGPMGLTVVSPGGEAGYGFFSSSAIWLMVVTSFFAAIAGALWTVKVSRYGRVLHAVRDDELFAASLGENTALLKIIAFALSAAIAAAAGGLYALCMGFVDPTNFSVFESVLGLAMVLLWKPATIWGPPMGAAVLVAIPELMRFSNITTAESANFRQIFFGGALIAVIYFRGRIVFAGRYGDLQ